jgi:type VI secretion system protein ImpJ
MKYLSRVVWSEGMYLGPHHFQAQSRYFEDSIRFATTSMWFEPWGIIAAQLDAEALKNGTVSLLHARGLFPDGLVFHMPESDALPEARGIGDHFPPVRDGVTVMLAVPPRRAEEANTHVEGEASHENTGERNGVVENGAVKNETLRYRAEAMLLHDETTGRDEKPVDIGRKNIDILFDTEVPGDLVTVPIARITRDGSGHYVFDEAFIPPAIEISASERLMAMLGRLIEILEEKSSRFARSGATGPGGQPRSWAEFSTREIANFWLLHTVNSALAPLRHQYLTKRGHPEQLYAEMLRLGGALCTFAFESHPRDLPLYDHRNLEKSFGDLDHHIRTHLETIVPTQYLEIPLVKRADFFYEGVAADQRALDRARWILGVRSAVGEPDLIGRTPALVKLCSKDFVPQLVKRALPGMALTHLPVPPSAIPVKADYQYFSVSRSGPCWDHIVQTRQIGLYVPGDLPNPSLELLVILEA